MFSGSGKVWEDGLAVTACPTLGKDFFQLMNGERDFHKAEKSKTSSHQLSGGLGQDKESKQHNNICHLSWQLSVILFLFFFSKITWSVRFSPYTIIMKTRIEKM